MYGDADLQKCNAFDIAILDAVYFYASIFVYLESDVLHEQYFVDSMLHQFSKEIKLDNKQMISVLNSMYNLIFRDLSITKDNYDDYAKKINGMTKFIRIFKSDLVDILIDKKDMGDSYKCSLIFDYGNYTVDSDFESTGIKKLMRLYSYFQAVDQGNIVFIDELDANLHDVYLCRLLEYVSEYAKGQLCFTLHNIGPMELLSKQANGLDFLTRNQEIVSWVKNGNYSAAKRYCSGKTKDSPFNIESFDFLKIFGAAYE